MSQRFLPTSSCGTQILVHRYVQTYVPADTYPVLALVFCVTVRRRQDQVVGDHNTAAAVLVPETTVARDFNLRLGRKTSQCGYYERARSARSSFNLGKKSEYKRHAFERLISQQPRDRLTNRLLCWIAPSLLPSM